MIALCGRSFVSATGHGGATFQVLLLDDPLPPATERQRIATTARELATVFIAPDRHQVALHNRKLERSLIAHGLLGAVHACDHLGIDVDHFSLKAGGVPVWTDDAGRHWLRAPAAWSPNERLRQVDAAAEVDSIVTAPPDEPVLVWAWMNAGTVRARFFGPSVGKPEDEACGSACMVLSHRLGRPLTVYHGRHCSLIDVRPIGDAVECGGRCVLDQVPAGHLYRRRQRCLAGPGPRNEALRRRPQGS